VCALQHEAEVYVQFANARIRRTHTEFRRIKQQRDRNGSCEALARWFSPTKNQGDIMKKYLMVICAAAAFVGCAQNRGGVHNRSSSETGASQSYDRSMQSTNSSNSITNDSSGAPGNSSGSSSGSSSSGTGSTSDRSSGANGQKN
jgi:hypothetical protein